MQIVHLLVAAVVVASSSALRVLVAPDAGSYAVYASSEANKPLLEGGSFSVFANGRLFNQLQLLDGPKNVSGSDLLGAWSGQRAEWRAATVSVVTTWRAYDAVEAAVFDVEFPNGANGTQVARQNCSGHKGCAWMVGSTFPSFAMSSPGLTTRACLTWESNQISEHAVSERGLPKLPATSDDGITGGPVVCFDPDTPGGGAGAFMVAPVSRELEWAQNNTARPGRWDMGPSGELTSLQPGSRFSTMVAFASGGASEAVMLWGSAALTLHGTTRAAPDKTLTKLGYWTDHGASAYFFQWTNPLSLGTPSTVLGGWYLNISRVVPLQYLQLDAWWYATDGWNACVEKWGPHPLYFTGGSAGVRELNERLGGGGLSLYQNYFCPRNNYSHSFPMVTTDDGLYSLPTPQASEAFYKALWAEGIEQGMLATEIDYLSVTWPKMSMFRSQQGAAVAWLGGMAQAAESAGVGLQACMLLPVVAMGTVAFPGFTNARGSPDFWRDENKPTSNLLALGYSSMLLHALALRPSKDTLWTTWPQPITGGMTNTHPNPQAHVLAAILSTGPVGISDYGGGSFTNASLVSRTCDAGGTLLQPSRPAFTIDSALGNPTLSSPPKRGGTLPVAGAQIWVAHADVSAASKKPPRPQDRVWRVESAPGARSWVGMAFNVTETYELQAADLRPQPAVGARLVWRLWPGHTDSCVDGAPASSCVDEGLPLPLHTGPAAIAAHFESLALSVYEASEEEGGWVFLGELGKVVSASPVRFTDLQATAASLSVTVHGEPSEAVVVTALTPAGGGAGSVVRTATVTVGSNGSVIATLHA